MAEWGFTPRQCACLSAGPLFFIVFHSGKLLILLLLSLRDFNLKIR